MVYSFIGMKPAKQAVAGKTTVNVKMQDETVGSKKLLLLPTALLKKKDLTGSISTIDSKLITVQLTSSLTQALEGTIAWVAGFFY